jgi:hypothetical protein
VKVVSPLSQVVQDIEGSVEAQRRRNVEDGLGALSDSEFILTVAESLLAGPGLTPRDIEEWRTFLGEDLGKRNELIRSLLVAGRRQGEEGVLCNPYDCWVAGTTLFVTPPIWRARAELVKDARPRLQSTRSASTRRSFTHSGHYAVSAIASLYRGGRFIEGFLENIASQTIFDRSELIIIDADSPEREGEIIAKYQERYPNIVYKRLDRRIGVYEAWNLGVQMARGKCLTNTNVDDLRRQDSFELQERALEHNPSADVVYQDFFYSFDPTLSFDEIARFGFKSELPIVTGHNLLFYNSPHNAPMWRSKLHDEVGLFDASLKSAGDWEFWMRCFCQGKRFTKINTPHVAYFQNPEGISTNPSTRGIAEGREIQRRHARKLISANLLLSRQNFAGLLGITPDWEARMSYYDVVQSRLKCLGDLHPLDQQL